MIPLAAIIIVFALMYAFVAWWSNTHNTRLVYRLWLAASFVWIVLCLALATQIRDSDWHSLQSWAALAGACALIPYLWLSHLHQARGRGPLPLTEDPEAPSRPASLED